MDLACTAVAKKGASAAIDLSLVSGTLAGQDDNLLAHGATVVGVDLGAGAVRRKRQVTAIRELIVPKAKVHTHANY